MAASTLTQRRVEKITPGDARREIPDGGQPGLYLIVQAALSAARVGRSAIVTTAARARRP